MLHTQQTQNCGDVYYVMIVIIFQVIKHGLVIWDNLGKVNLNSH